MFTYSSSEAVIPSLTFTKAELLYAISCLLKDIPDNDNSTKIEMVEVRHYLNLNQGEVSKALSEGTISRPLEHSEDKKVESTDTETEAATMPSMGDLKRQFPNLSEEEIKEIIEKARIERESHKEEKEIKSPTLPQPPSFVAKPIEESENPIMKQKLSPKELKDIENSKKFASMLGSF